MVARCLLESGGRCGEHVYQAFVPVSEPAIFEHLQGRRAIDALPPLEDETYRFLAIDFDKKASQEAVTAVAGTCGLAGIPAEKWLGSDRAIGYARGEAPLGYAEPPDEQTVEYDQEALQHFQEDP